MRLLLFFCLLASGGAAQTIGGASAYQFLKLPAPPLLTASGGVNTSYDAGDAGMAANNPALLKPALHAQLQSSFNFFLGGIKAYGLSGAYHKNATTLGGQVFYVDYGSLPQTDVAGNESGMFRPRDFAVQVSAARRYLGRWTYGATLKFISSSYGIYSSSAIAADIGLLYTDSANKLTVSFAAKNMGAQLSTYASEKEDLPFDLQVGITKRLTNAPFGFSLTAQQVHRFNIAYEDAIFNNENGLSPPSRLQNVLMHFVLATHIYLGNHLEASIGYNALRRQELSVPDAGNGLVGFSAGLRISLPKVQVLYARSSYQKGIAYNQIGVAVQLNKLGGLGR